MKFIFYLLIIIDVILTIYLLTRNFIKTFIEKRNFKKEFYKEIYKICKDNDYYLLNKLAIKNEDKVVHFDHIIFGDKFIYPLVTRFYNVGIKGSKLDKSIFLYKNTSKFKIITNPLTLHKERVDYLKAIIQASEDMIIGLVVVNKGCVIEERLGDLTTNPAAINIDNLKNVIRKYENKDVPLINKIGLKSLVLEFERKSCEE